MKRHRVFTYLLISITIHQHIINGELTDTLKHCCDLGTNWANQNLKCAKFQSPVAGVLEEEQDFCLNSVSLCCNRNYRVKQCLLGQEAAKEGKKCIAPLGATGDYFKSCCEACNQGLLAKGSECAEISSTLKSPADGAFKACCEDNVSSTTQATSTTFTTTLATRTTLATSIGTPKGPAKNKNLGNLCELLHDQLCAQICIPLPDSYKCACRKGFVLMKDGKSCMQKSIPNRCKDNNPCDHECVDTGVAIQCLCDEGYKLAEDKKTCKDIDECKLGVAACEPEQICVNTEGSYNCEDRGSNPQIAKTPNRCPEGYAFNQEKQVCDDIDECTLNLHHCLDQAACENNVGSYICRDEDLYSQEKSDEDITDCPPGFHYKAAVETCQDIDECASGTDNCNRESEVCLNTHGSFICKNLASKSSCPAGFKMNVYTRICEDINECQENPDLCSVNEECIDEPGGYKCLPRLQPPPIPNRPQLRPNLPTSPVTPSIPRTTITNPTTSTTVSTTTTTTTTTTTRPPRTTQVRRPQPPAYTPQVERPAPPQHHQRPNQEPPQKSYSQEPPPIINIPYYNSGAYPTSPNDQDDRRNYYPNSCKSGLSYSSTLNRCVDIDECEEFHPCDSNQDCRNVVGSYVCVCKLGFELDQITSACIDVNECQRGNHNCLHSQRCDNTIGSYSCFRFTSCGTGYTLNLGSGQCEDDDECLLGHHNCDVLGPKWECKNTLGSFRCEKKCFSTECLTGLFRPAATVTTTHFEPRGAQTITSQFKKCLPGYLMNSQGDCIDVNECEQGPSPCRRYETCVNTNGSYRCLARLQCKMGYELNESGTECVDINECATGTHQCSKGQICINREGFHLCQCPPGHKLNYLNECEDIDECQFNSRGRICPQNADCENTIGSYTCSCKVGFSKADKNCNDVDECSEQQGLCHHNCVNTWGSYRCSCKPGFTLNDDNRTCSDMDECTKFEDAKLCVGTCENIPGSYKCRCPKGYRLGEDGRSCQDIDECLRGNMCPRDDVCFNTRGSYRCTSIVCPPNYIRDSDHKNRCKRTTNYCGVRDLNCLHSPSSYSYNFITFVSNVPMPSSGQLDLFTLRGPLWDKTTATFAMELKNAKCPSSVRKATAEYFRMKRKVNQATLSLLRPIDGPQEVELQLEMEYYIDGKFVGLAVAKLFIFVSEYEF